MNPLAKSLIVFGLSVAAVGVLVLLAAKLPWLGRLPGDIRVEREGFRFYFPLTTSLLVSAAVSLVLMLLRRR